ncbi:MAG: Gfo/Idh/MocA family oxidoreductase [bacterium]|nr:Gfo/Idh/MocA family oxidoreductase [bacterium]
MINWGVIGCGGIAYRRTIPEGITKAKNAKLISVMDIDKNKAKEVGEKFGVEYFTDIEDILNDTRIQAVYIATPVYLHKEQTIKSALSGKHILCEKPLALNSKEAKDIIDICKRSHVKLGVGYMMRFHSLHNRAKEMVKNGELGEIVFARAQLSCWYPPIPGAWRQDPVLGGGGALIDMGSHCLDLLEYILDTEIETVSCFADNAIHNYKSEDSSVVMVRFKNKAHGVIDSYFNIPDNSSKNRLEVYGTKGSILAEGTIGQSSYGKMVIFLEKDSKGYDASQIREIENGIKIEVPFVNIYQAEIEAFSSAIENDKEPPIPGEIGLWNLKIIEACYESSKSKLQITLRRE